jgi:hypothetical protein
MKCQNPICNNIISDVKSGYQRKTCCRKCLYELRTYNSQNTCLEKYGQKSATGTESSNLASKKTKLEKYGSETYNNRDKAKETLNEKYGVDNISQIQFVKDKKIKTCLENFGVEHPGYSTDIKEKSKKTKLEKYGSETYNNRDKAKETMLERFGFEHAMKSANEVEKLKQVFINNLGVDNPSKLQSVKDKKKETCMLNYGVDNPSHSPELLKKIINNSYQKKLFIMPSGKQITLMGFEPGALQMLLNTQYTENDFDFDNIPMIDYIFKNVKRKYIPDFYIPKENLIIEVKSIFTYKLHKLQNHFKRDATMAAGYNFEFLIVDKKGRIINEPNNN